MCSFLLQQEHSDKQQCIDARKLKSPFNRQYTSDSSHCLIERRQFIDTEYKGRKFCIWKPDRLQKEENYENRSFIDRTDAQRRSGGALWKMPLFSDCQPGYPGIWGDSQCKRRAGGGAGIQSAQLIATKGASVVLTGSCGPNALQVFEKSGIIVVTGVTGSVLQVVQQFAAGSLSPASSTKTWPRFSGIPGQGKGGVRGMGGGGRGMGGKGGSDPNPSGSK